MVSIKFTYYYSDAGRRAQLLAGRPANQTGTVTITPDSPEWAAAASFAEFSADGGGEIRLLSRTPEYIAWDREPTAADLLGNLYSIQAAKQKKLDCEVADVAARAAANLAAKKTVVVKSIYVGDSTGPHDLVAPDSGGYGGKKLNYAAGRESEVAAWHSPEWAEWEAECERANAATFELVESLSRKNAETKQRAEAAAEAAKKAGLEKLAAWTREHGSDLARLRLEEGYDCWVSAAREDYADAIYGDIRAETGLPEYQEIPGDYDYDSEPRKCPTVEEIVAFRAVAAAAKKHTGVTAELVRVTYDDDGEKTARTEIVLTIQVPGAGDIERYLLA